LENSSTIRKLPKETETHKITQSFFQREQYEEALARAEELGHYFYLVYKKDREKDGKISGLLAHLRSKTNKVCKLFIDSSKTLGLLQPMMDGERMLTDGLNGFKCFYIENAQKAAASHYNDNLQRDRVSSPS
jgi:hypothetical protein